MSSERIPSWTLISPAVAWAFVLLLALSGTNGFLLFAAGIALLATVSASVYHAEVIAHRIGEPFGTLVLAVSVTVIEVALIVSVMVSAPTETSGVARDTVFAAVMIVMNGIIGLCLLFGGMRHHEQGFQIQGASAALAVLAALTTLTMVFPNVVSTAAGPLFSTPQLLFAGSVSLALYGAFIFIQTVRHRDYFLSDVDDANHHASLPSIQKNGHQHSRFASFPYRSRWACQAFDAGSRTGNSFIRPASERSGHSDCDGGLASRVRGGA
ncbi:calcium:proton antiporter [Rhizobium leguminosarum]|uniref:calcium:proton antiporter n=1 Tax=Rhizobium leguminosarum TaxID=384 RepID=UPI0021BBD272|nr:hypothetical protein [Rhizobium leguminosarum]